MKYFVTVKPNARQEKIEVVSANTLRAWVTAPPLRGQANRALLDLLARHLKLKESQLSIKQGLTSRTKLIETLDN